MSETEANSYTEGSKIHLMGYTSTTLKKEVALGYALDSVDQERVHVVFEIDFRGQTGLFKLTDDYSAYPGESEILVQDGLKYLITSNTLETDKTRNKQYRLIKLSYPAA